MTRTAKVNNVITLMANVRNEERREQQFPLSGGISGSRMEGKILSWKTIVMGANILAMIPLLIVLKNLWYHKSIGCYLYSLSTLSGYFQRV